MFSMKGCGGAAHSSPKDLFSSWWRLGALGQAEPNRAQAKNRISFLTFIPGVLFNTSSNVPPQVSTHLELPGCFRFLALLAKIGDVPIVNIGSNYKSEAISESYKIILIRALYMSSFLLKIWGRWAELNVMKMSISRKWPHTAPTGHKHTLCQ